MYKTSQNTNCKTTLLTRFAGNTYYKDCGDKVDIKGHDYCPGHMSALGKGDMYDSKGRRIMPRIRKGK